ncbi:MAG: hypothetical protein J1F20_01465 [Muribaculaceae bacterium]|nr:hypothetical protein [Muribaculaceae bacterium]
MNTPIRYTDEKDRAYGVAGMALALVIWDGRSYLASLSLDNPVGDSVTFSPAFGFAGNPRLSASLAWGELLRQFEISTAMLVGNVMCRAYVYRSTSLAADTADSLRLMIRSHGHDSCSLDEDESDIVFNKTRRYLDRVFTHSGVAQIARHLADTLAANRSLTANEVLDILAPLDNL